MKNFSISYNVMNKTRNSKKNHSYAENITSSTQTEKNMKYKLALNILFSLLYINSLSFLITAEVLEVNTCSLADDSFFKETRGGRVKARDKESTEIVDSESECISICHQRKCFSFNYYKTDSGEQRCDIFRFGMQSPNGRIFFKKLFKNISKSIYMERIPCYTNRRKRDQSKLIKKIYQAHFCDEIRRSGQTESGIYEVTTSVPLYNSQKQDDDDDDEEKWKKGREFQRISCEMDLLDGGWTVVQRNTDGFPTSYTWNDYKYGFGDLSADFWLGNEALYQLTKNKDTEFLVQMEGKTGKKYFNFFNEFWVADEKDSYKLRLGKPKEKLTPALDSLHFEVHDGRNFSVSPLNGHAGWWYYQLYGANVFLNGNPDSKRNSKRIVWYAAFGTGGFVSFKSSVMYVRRKWKRNKNNEKGWRNG